MTTLAITNIYERSMDKAFFYTPEVAWLGGNEYAVSSTSDLNTTYHVILAGDFTLKGADCTCPAGETHASCVHRAAAHIFEVNQEAYKDLGQSPIPAVAPELTLSSNRNPLVGCGPVCRNAETLADLCAICYSEVFTSIQVEFTDDSEAARMEAAYQADKAVDAEIAAYQAELDAELEDMTEAERTEYDLKVLAWEQELGDSEF